VWSGVALQQCGLPELHTLLFHWHVYYVLLLCLQTCKLANLPVQGMPWRLPRNSKQPNATLLLPLYLMMVVGWVAVPRPGTHRTLISLGAVGSWSVGWGSLAWDWEVSGLLFCCLFLLSLNASGV